MERSFRQRLIIGHVAIVLVIVLSASTAVIALRTAATDTERAAEVDQRLALIEQLRADTRALSMSVRRYLLSGDLEEQQRALAIASDIKAEREQLRPRSFSPQGPVLEADIEEYVATMVNAMSSERVEKPVERIARFEDELLRVRNQLAITFDQIVSGERSRLEASRSTQALATSAQWAVLIGGGLGVLLAIGSVIAVVRRLGRRGPSSFESADRIARARDELLAAATELRDPLERIIAETAQLRLRPRHQNELRALERISRHATRVNGLLAEVLDVNAMQTGTVSLRREPCDAAVLVDRAIKEHRDMALEHSVKLRYEAQLSVSVSADRERIRHVLDTLLEAAIIAARPGAELLVHVAMVHGGVRFAIIQAGAAPDAIANEDLALSLATRVVEAHGGRLGVETSPMSRTYWFTLPAETYALI